MVNKRKIIDILSAHCENSFDLHQCEVNPLTPTVAIIMGKAIKHPVAYQTTSFVFKNMQAL